MQVFPEFDRIDDPDDGGIDRGRLLPQRLAGRLAFDHDEHALADPRTNRIDRDECRAARIPGRGHRLDQQQLRALELPVLLRRDDGADDAAICIS